MSSRSHATTTKKSNGPSNVASSLSKPWQSAPHRAGSVSRASSQSASQNGADKLSRALPTINIPLQDLSEADLEGMEDRPSSSHIQGDGHSQQPLLQEEDGPGRGRSGFGSPGTPVRPPFLTRRSTMRSRSPDLQAKLATQKKYTYAMFFLGLSLVSFVVQTETAVYIRHELDWDKAYCMLYLTHGSWSLLWPVQLLILRLQNWSVPWETFWRRHIYLLRTTAQMVETQSLSIPRSQHSPIPYMLRMTSFVTCALTIAGGSWYVAVSLTSPSDLTAIYNCSAFFAYAFSVPILKEKLRWDKSFAVAVAIVGVLIVAYGDATPTKHGGKSGGSVGGGTEETPGTNRVAGNLIIGVGSVLYGFYEVLYKRLACPPEGTSPVRGMIFANTFGSLMGAFTLLILWVPLPILHWTGLEKFEFPNPAAAKLLAISVLANAIFSGSFLVLISLTSPVLSSVAALLTIFLVALVDWMWTGVPLSFAAGVGGLLIIAAFLLLSWSTYKEMAEESRKKHIDLSDDDTETED